MRLTVPTQQLLDQLHLSFAFACPNAEQDALKCIKIAAHDGVVSVMATDRRSSVVLQAGRTRIVESGAVLIPRKATRSVQYADEERIAVESTPSGVRLNGAQMLSPRPDEFPDVVTDAAAWYREVDRETLIAALMRTFYAADHEGQKPVLGVVAFEFLAPEIVLAATDGNRISSQRIESEGQREHERKCLVPIECVEHLLNVLKKQDDEMVRMHATDAVLVVKTESATMQFRLLSGRYPDWRSAISHAEGPLIKAAAGDLKNAIRQCAITVAPDARLIEIKDAYGVIVLSSTLSEVGNSKIPCKVDGVARGAVIRVDHNHIADIVAPLSPDVTVAIKWSPTGKPIEITTDDGFQAVIGSL